MASTPPPGTGYFISNSANPGPGILLLSSPWGLSSAVKEKADELADAGFTVLAPDLYDGALATTAEQARTTLIEADMNIAASLVQSSLRILRAACPDPEAPVGVLGYAAGASWGLWLSVRFAEHVAAVAAFCGTQSIAFDGSQASYLLHFAEQDDDVTDEERAMMGLNLQLARCVSRVEQHDGVSGGFAERNHPNFDPATGRGLAPDARVLCVRAQVTQGLKNSGS